MNRKFHWGIAALIIVLIAAGGFMYWQWSTVQQLKEQLAQDEKMLEEREKPVAKNELPPAEPGKKWVPHGDHFHQVPIDAPDTRQGEPAPVAKDDPVPQPAVPKTKSGGLTYHAELLKTNPVKALRLQTIERGHWSAKYIPPFPPDDAEAQAYARILYIKHYYESIGDTDNPVYKKSGKERSKMLDVLNSYAYGPRTMDLMRLTWSALRKRGKVGHASNYFNEYTGVIKDEYADLVK